jgi:hypothetical protein
MYASGLSVSEAGVMHMGAGMQGKREHNGLSKHRIDIVTAQWA